MKKCPKCGAELPDCSKYCFYCMNTLYERKTISMPKIKVVPWPVISSAAAVTAAAAISAAIIFINRPSPDIRDNNVSPDTAITASAGISSELPTAAASVTAVPAEASSAASSSATEATTAAPTVTTTATEKATTTTAAATTTPTTTTTTTTAAPITTQPTVTEPPAPVYLSEEGATVLSRAYAAYLNPIRQRMGASEFHVSGQLDRACQMSVNNLGLLEAEINPYPYFNQVGLTNDNEIKFLQYWVYIQSGFQLSGNSFVDLMKKDFPGAPDTGPGVMLEGANLAYELRDWKYISVVFRPSENTTRYTFWIVAMR